MKAHKAKKGKGGLPTLPRVKGPAKLAAFRPLTQGVSQAALLDGRWKALRLRTPTAPLQLFDLQTDPAEARDLAASRPDLVARAEKIFREDRADNEHWKLAAAAPARKK